MLSRKHIKAPRSFDPGPGHPREHLAYLSRAEMEMLRQMTDGEVEQGPKGLPSFAVTTGKTTSNTVTSGGVGSNSPAGGTGSRSTTSVGSNSTTASRSASAASTAGRIGSAASGNKVGMAKAAAPAAAAKAPASTSSRIGSAVTGNRVGMAPKAPTASVARPAAAATPARSTAPAAPRVSSSSAMSPPVRPAATAGKIASASNSTSKPAAASAFSDAGIRKPISGTAMAPRIGMTSTGYVQQNLRGPLGPNGEMRKGITPSTDAYRLGQVAQGLYGKYGERSTTDAARFMGNYARALPGEAAINMTRNPNEQGQRMRDLGRTGINQSLNISPDRVLGGIDTYAIPGLQNASKNSMGLVRADSPQASRARDALSDAMTRPNTVSPAAREATNFTAPGTPLSRISPSIQQLGQTPAGNFGLDPAYAKRTAAANAEAARRLGSTPGTPATLPAGALSQDPNYGGFGGTPAAMPTRAMPGRFGGFAPASTGMPATRIASPAAETGSLGPLRDDANAQAFKKESAAMASLEPSKLEAKPQESVNKVLDTAAKAIGLNETTKQAALKDYLATGGVNLDPKTTAWCAAFVNSTLAKNGLPGTGKLTARSFLNYGTPTTQPQPGDIAVFWRGTPNGWQGHVGFYKGMSPDGKSIRVLGGNQGNAVSEKEYPASQLLGFRQIPGSAQGPSVAQAAKPPSGGLLSTGAKALTGLARGQYQMPSLPGPNPAFKAFAEAGPFTRAAMGTAFGAMYGGGIRDAFGNGLRSVQNFLSPSASAVAQGGSAAPSAPARSLSGFDRDRYLASITSNRDAPRDTREVRRSGGGGIRRPKAAPVPEAPIVNPVPPDNFLTEAQRAAVLRRLLGEEWFA